MCHIGIEFIVRSGLIYSRKRILYRSMQPQTIKILLVEDELFIADLYAYQLRKSGFQVNIAGDGLNGLKALNQEVFDLLLLDIMLPGMNGIEMLKTFRNQHPDSKMAVLLLTNYGPDDVINEVLPLHVQGYLLKASYTPERIVEEVKRTLDEFNKPQTPPAVQPT